MIRNKGAKTRLFACILCLQINITLAEESKMSVQNFMTVEDNLHLIDKDKDGIVTVYEVRAYIESVHGKNYKKEVLDDMESSANGKSCSTPFAKSLYQ